MKKISVIIPVYNVEEYLEKCVDSLLKQTWQNFEIILVDDGSRDASPAICDALAAEDERVKVLHKENGGVSSARNAGLAVANGYYIAFVDSDDFVEPAYLERLAAPYDENQVELTVCGYYFRDEVKAREQSLLDRAGLQAALFACKEYPYIEGYLWNKLYLNDIISEHQLCFDEKYRMSEDTLFNFQYFQYVKRAAVVTEALYHYVIRETSAMRSKPEENELAMQALIDYFIEHTEEQQATTALIGWAFKYWIRIADIALVRHDKAHFREIRQTILQYRKMLMKHDELTRIEKLFVVTLRFCPAGYILYKKMKYGV